MTDTAILSDDYLFRYALSRALAPSPSAKGAVLFLGVNPSTADARVNDHSVRKMMEFAKRWSFQTLWLGNAFAYRSADVRVLAAVNDPVGPKNDEHLAMLMSKADLVVPCWGSRGKLPPRLHYRLDEMDRMLKACSRPVECLGTTVTGDPKHPLMLSYETRRRPYTPLLLRG